jgi:hypothetical protein
MAEASVPKIDGDGSSSEGEMRRRAERVELVGALTSEHHRARGQILDREAIRVKFNANIIIAGKFAHRNKIFHNRWREKNIVQLNG